MSSLFLGNRSIDTLKALSQTTHTAQYQRLLTHAATYHDWLPPLEHPDRSITFIGMAAANLALAYRLSDDPAYLETLRKWLKVVISYPHWGKKRKPDHDLDAAWNLFGWSLAYDWIGNDLSAADQHALKGKLLLQGQRMYDYALETENVYWGSSYWQNHNWICYTGLAAAAYALKNQYPETIQWAQSALENFNTVYSVLSEDGSNSEGVVYWCYGVLWLMIYADLAAQNEDVHFYNTPYLQNTFYFRLYLSGPNLVDTANFGDCHDRRSAHSRAMYYWFARHHQNGHAQWLADHFDETGEWDREAREGMLKPGLLPQAFLDFLWFDSTVTGSSIKELPLSRCFPDWGFVSARTSWKEDAAFMAFKSSAPLGRKAWAAAHDLMNTTDWDAISGGHLHPDENSFILMRGADYLMVDEGYSQAKQSVQHNTVLVDGKGQYNEGIYHVAKGLSETWGANLEAYYSSQDVVYVRGEAAGAYDPQLGLKKFNRQMIFWDQDLIFLFDQLSTAKPRKFDWILQTDSLAEKVSDGRFTVTTGDSRLDITMIAPDEMISRHFEQEVVAVPSSAEPDNVIRRIQHTLSISPSTPVDHAIYMAAFAIGAKDEELPRVESNPSSGGVAATIHRNEKQIVAGFATTARPWKTDETCVTDAPWFAVEFSGGALRKLAVGESTRTFVRDALWCAASSPAKFSFREDEWAVQSTTSNWVSLRVPEGKTALFDKKPLQKHPVSGLVRIQIPAGQSIITLQ